MMKHHDETIASSVSAASVVNPATTTTTTTPPSLQQQAVRVGCCFFGGCFIRRRRMITSSSSAKTSTATPRTIKHHPRHPRRRSQRRRSTVYHDTTQTPGSSSSMIKKESKDDNNDDHSNLRTVQVVQQRSSQFYFFNAKQNEDDDDDIDDVDVDPYPIITTSYVVPPPSRRMSMLEPESLLLSLPYSEKDDENEKEEEEAQDDEDEEKKEEQQHSIVPASIQNNNNDAPLHPLVATTTTTTTKRRRSLLLPLRRSMLERQQRPKEGDKGGDDAIMIVVVVEERGYPGQLNAVELEECLKLYHKLQEDYLLQSSGSSTTADDHDNDNNSVLYDMVYQFRQVEDVPYALCRFLRSTKFQSNKLLKKLQTLKKGWKQAAAQDFYPDPAKALGVPMPIFLQMYPFVYYGNAKNGCPVSYLKAGHIQTEGMASVTTVERMEAFFWHSFAHTLVHHLERAKALHHPNFCRAEFIQVTDLKGISRAQCTADALQVVQMSAQVGECFPETLHSMILLNAPSWFSVIWRMITAFLDPRLARMIEVYSSESRGRERLLELVSAKEVPSDFGGTGPTMEQCIQQEQQQLQQEQKDGTCSDNNKNTRVAVELVDLRRRHTSKRIELCELSDGESAVIDVYTKSVTGASLQVFRGSEHFNIENAIVCRNEMETRTFSKEALPTPYCTRICSHIAGPGQILMELQDLGDYPLLRKKFSHGHFLVAATIQEN